MSCKAIKMKDKEIPETFKPLTSMDAIVLSLQCIPAQEQTLTKGSFASHFQLELTTPILLEAIKSQIGILFATAASNTNNRQQKVIL